MGKEGESLDDGEREGGCVGGFEVRGEIECGLGDCGRAGIEAELEGGWGAAVVADCVAHWRVSYGG